MNWLRRLFHRHKWATIPPSTSDMNQLGALTIHGKPASSHFWRKLYTEDYVCVVPGCGAVDRGLDRARAAVAAERTRTEQRESEAERARAIRDGQLREPGTLALAEDTHGQLSKSEDL